MKWLSEESQGVIRNFVCEKRRRGGLTTLIYNEEQKIRNSFDQLLTLRGAVEVGNNAAVRTNFNFVVA